MKISIKSVDVYGGSQIYVCKQVENKFTKLRNNTCFITVNNVSKLIKMSRYFKNVLIKNQID